MIKSGCRCVCGLGDRDSRREDSLATLVDTIIVLRPDSILLHVGQAVEMLTLIETQGRRASGEVLPTYPSFLDVEDMTIAQSREAGLTGQRVGRTHVKITVMSRNAHAPLKPPGCCRRVDA